MLRIIYSLDGMQKCETIEPKILKYNDRIFLDKYSMLQHAEQYGDCLRECGAREVKIEWGWHDEKAGKSGEM